MGQPVRRQGRKVMWGVGLALCYCTGVFSMCAVWRVPERHPWAGLGLFGGAVLLAVVAGVLVGRGIRFWLGNKERAVVPFILLSFVNLSVFVLLGKPMPTQQVNMITVEASAHLLVSAVLLITANASLLGFLLIPGKGEWSRRKGLWLVGLPYASILVGVCVGFRTGIWQMRYVPLESWKEPKPPSRRMTLEEAVRDAEAWFPPKITVDESDPRWVTFQAPEREAVEIVPGRGVVEATGAVATIGGREVQILGYAIHPPRFEEREEVPGEPGATRLVNFETAPTTLWAPDGTPLDKLPRFDSGSGAWNTFDYQCKFCLSVPEDWNISNVHPPTLRQLPWGEPRHGNSSLRKGNLWTWHSLQLPVPSPVELRLGIFDAEKKSYTMPAREGAKMVLERNRLLLVKMLPWAHTSTGGGVGDTLRLSRPLVAGNRFGSGPFTTVMFYCIEPKAVRIEAVLRSGESTRAVEWLSTEGWLGCKFQVKMDDIREFRILEEPEVFEVVFHLSEIKGFPAENEGVTSRLDIFYPRVLLDDPVFSSTRFPLLEKLDRFLRSVLGNRFVREVTMSRWINTDPDAGPVEHEHFTVREILDLYYPGRWCVSGGRVYTTRDRFGPIVWKVREAVRELREGEP